MFERRFSVNKEVMVDNLSQRSLIAQPIIHGLCDQRADDWSRLVGNRVNGVLADLPAADARYHDKCYQEFWYVYCSQPLTVHTVFVETDIYAYGYMSKYTY